MKFRVFPEITYIETVQAGPTNISSMPIYSNIHFRHMLEKSIQTNVDSAAYVSHIYIIKY